MQLAVRNRKLNRLVRDLELPLGLDDFALGGVNESEVRKVFGQLEFRTLTERVLRLRGTSGSPVASETPEDAEPVRTKVPQAELPESKAISLTELLDWAAKQSEVGLHLGFSDGRIVSIGAATISDRCSSAVDASEADKLGQYLASPASKVIFGAKDVERKVIEAGYSLRGVSGDPYLFAYLLNPIRRGYSIDDVAGEYLGIAVQRSAANQLVPETGVDSSLDAWLAIALAEQLWPLVQEQGQDVVYETVEAPSSSTLAKMEATGITVDSEALNALLGKLTDEVREAEKSCFEIIDKEINLASPKQLQAVLFEDLGMTGNKKVKTGFSTNAEALNTLFEETGHPFLEALLKHREVTKIRQMVEVLLKSIGADGRVHTNYVQTGTSTGRLSSEGPNLQNIPIKTERGREIRDAFVVGKGFETLLTADYSQIEMRIMAHLSEDEGLIEAFKTGEDLHRFVGSRIFGVSPAEVTPAMRSKVKAMSYGLVYGLSEYGLAKQLRISNAEAKQLMQDYFDRFGGVRRYLARVVDHAKLNGYTATTLGRRRPFDDLKSPIFQIRENARRAALNAPIQGTAADIMKLAMVRIDHAMVDGNLKSRMLLQVHDELVFEVAAGELETLKALVVQHMANVVELSVPLEVHLGVGTSWDKAGH